MLGIFLVVVLLLILGLPYAIALLVTRHGTRPMDRGLTSAPADYGLEFEGVSFEAADGIRLSGWFLGGGHQEATVACAHGLFRSRHEVLDRAAFFRSQGYDTLVFDFRGHGESEDARTTLGYRERLDYEGAVRFLQSRRPGSPVVLYGVSMGAAAALLAARETPQVRTVVADSPFLSIEHTVVHHVRLIFGLPRFPFASALLFFLELEGGFDREAFDLERAVKEMGERPILIIAGENDRRMPPDLQRRLYQASTNPASRFVSIPEATHGAAYVTATGPYQVMLLSFLRSVGLRRPGSGEVEDEGSSHGSR